MALYHTHRPQKFSDILHQEHIVTTLQNQIMQGSSAHAYLFFGPRGVGKTTAARLLAKALNCTERAKTESEPCNSCPSCTEIAQSRSIDVLEMDAASTTSVDDVRANIIENVQFKPTISRYKIFIIDEVHMLSTSAFNALLKTLEEPPEYVVFILATTDPHKLPATIISRCQRFKFGKVPGKELGAYLQKIAEIEGIKISAEIVGRIVLQSEGCVRDAVSLLEQLMGAGEKNISAENAELLLPSSLGDNAWSFTNALAARDSASALTMLAEAADGGIDITVFARQVIDTMRYALLHRTDPLLVQRELILNDTSEKILKEISRALSQKELVCLLDMTLARTSQIPASPVPELPFEMLIVEWCSSGEKCEEEAPEPVQPQKKTEPAAARALASVKKIISGEPDVPIEKIHENWNAFTSAVESKAPSLVFLLNMASVSEISGSTLTLSVPYKFHKEKLEEHKTRLLMEEIWQDIAGTRIKITAAVSEQEPDESRHAAHGNLQELAAAFGGEVVQ